MKSPIPLAEKCQIKGKPYSFYVHHCNMVCIVPMSERKYNEVGKKVN